MNKHLAMGTLVLAAATCAVGCGVGPKPKNASDAAFAETTQGDDEGLDEDGDTYVAKPRRKKAEEPTSEPSPRTQAAGRKTDPDLLPEEWRPTEADCRALAVKYEELLRVVEMEKLNQRKLSDAQRKSAEANVQQTVEKGRDNWLDACHDIVGTLQLRPRWQCAVKADSLDRFRACMDGKLDAELTSPGEEE